MLKYDLHLHTDCSDGNLSPTDLIKRAVLQCVDVIAITDHDSIHALPLAHEFINQEKIPLHLINGIEISTSWEGEIIHILGLNIDYQHPKITELVQSQVEKRIIRAKKIAEILEKKGFNDVYKNICNLVKTDVITRPHFAQYLIHIGAVKNIKSAFNKFLKKGASAYVTIDFVAFNDAINIIHLAGGVSVLAHPLRYEINKKKFNLLLQNFKEAKGMAIEVVQSNQNDNETERLAQLAEKFDFYGSVGSDFHFKDSYIEIGKIQALPENVKPIWQLFK